MLKDASKPFNNGHLILQEPNRYLLAGLALKMQSLWMTGKWVSNWPNSHGDRSASDSLLALTNVVIPHVHGSNVVMYPK